MNHLSHQSVRIDHVPFTLTMITDVKFRSSETWHRSRVRHVTYDYKLNIRVRVVDWDKEIITVEFYTGDHININITPHEDVNCCKQFILNTDGRSYGYRSNMFRIADAPNLHQFWRQCWLDFIVAQYGPILTDYFSSADVIRLICSY